MRNLVETETAVEKRRHPRTLVQITLKGVRLDPDGGEVVDMLRMSDISRSGMGVTVQRRYYPGQRLVLCLPLTDESGRRNIYATVRRCGKLPSGEHTVGLEFDSMTIGESCANEGMLAAA